MKEMYTGEKYNEFRIDVKPYNDAYHDFMSFIGGSVAVGIKDVKDWLSRGESDIEKDAKKLETEVINEKV